VITVAALYVRTGGPYFGLPGVEPWDIERDARRYPGPHPVVAHPPCARWCRLAGLVESRGGQKRGDDGGCFAAALAAVQRWGGVLEHPDGTAAWWHHGLRSPVQSGGWTRTAAGWTCSVEQGMYGHRARKATWLYAFGVDAGDLPELRWGAAEPRARVSEARGRTGDPRHGVPHAQRVERMARLERETTPDEFRDVLVAIARSARPA
jgi:hypothetical protein